MSPLRRPSPIAVPIVRPLALLAVLAAPAAAGVLVVDASGGGEHTSLLQALAVAQDGDTLLVRPGDYSGFVTDITILDRSLTIAADGTGPVITGPIRVVQTVPGKRVLLRGLTVAAQSFNSLNDGLDVQGGEVFAEDCSFKGKDGQVSIGGIMGFPGARVDSGHLVLARCTMEGGRGQDSFFPYVFNPTRGGFGLQVFERATVYDCTVIGGDGGDFVGFDGNPGEGGQGGAGIVATHGILFLAGTTVVGGDGGDGNHVSASPPDHAGGDAITLHDVCQLEQLDVTLQPGAGGQIEGRGTGPAGDVIDGPSSTVTTHPGPYRSYALGPPTPEGDTLQFDYAGLQGDLLLIFVAPAPGTLPLPAKQGVWHLGAPLFGPWLFGPVAAVDGTLSLSIPVPSAGLGPDAAVLLYEQMFVKPATGPALLSSPTTHLIVDGSL